VIAVVGYASVDRTVHVDRLPAPGVTARVLSVAADGPLRPGGIGHAATALAATVDDDVVPICAVGDDDAGRAFIAALATAGCRVHGVLTAQGRSPTAELLHDPDGATACVFDPGVDWNDLDERQGELLAAADVVVVMVAPPAVVRATLAASRSDATVAWIVKNDPAALLPDIVDALCGRADIVFLNVAESSVVEVLPADGAPITVCTEGARPVTVTTQGRSHTYAVPPVTVRNPTGAGDAFAGGYLAAWLGGADDEACVAAGAEAARRLMEAAP
jgi:sugar/nucleoside kinase (ribokinase family)